LYNKNQYIYRPNHQTITSTNTSYTDPRGLGSQQRIRQQYVSNIFRTYDRFATATIDAPDRLHMGIWRHRQDVKNHSYTRKYIRKNYHKSEKWQM